jgi:hypothetical protein
LLLGANGSAASAPIYSTKSPATLRGMAFKALRADFEYSTLNMTYVSISQTIKQTNSNDRDALFETFYESVNLDDSAKSRHSRAGGNPESM